MPRQTSPMRVVSNTAPLSNLAIVDRLALLRARYERIIIPRAVDEELRRLVHPGGREALAWAMSDGWIAVETVPAPAQASSFQDSLDPGEAEALALALQT